VPPLLEDELEDLLEEDEDLLDDELEVVVEDDEEEEEEDRLEDELDTELPADDELVPEGTEHSLVPPATLVPAPKVTSPHTKLPLSVL